ncbi:MAG: hypothetical protein KZQ86_13725, partial [Candidatus Thiodiazotropha sp. (ex Lucinoma kastoroae)]|nr:hypothetical protein [Candidatus Thiodiazotropha sp. (ex Lucinoma kastoroae)]
LPIYRVLIISVIIISHPLFRLVILGVMVVFIYHVFSDPISTASIQLQKIVAYQAFITINTYLFADGTYTLQQ